MNSGSAPTDLQARTGLFTPPGMICAARWNRFRDVSVFMVPASFLLDCWRLWSYNSVEIALSDTPIQVKAAGESHVNLPVWSHEQGSNPKQLAKFLSYVLGAGRTSSGWCRMRGGRVKIKDLLKAVCEEAGWRYVRRGHINEVLITLAKPPVAVADGWIYARDRTHLPAEKTAPVPPKLLYTCVRRRPGPMSWKRGSIRRPPAGFVASPEMARRIGRRSDPDPVPLTVRTADAMENGVVFYRPARGSSPLIFCRRIVLPDRRCPRKSPRFRKNPTAWPEKRTKHRAAFFCSPRPIRTRSVTIGGNGGKRRFPGKKAGASSKKYPADNKTV